MSAVTSARVLLVDDNSGLLYACNRFLLQAGHVAFPACEPKQALDIVRNVSALDLVVADMRMPQMSGAELIHEISTMTPGIAGVLMTAGIPDRCDLPKGIQVLRKPFSMKELALILERLMARSAQLSAGLKSQVNRAAILQRQNQQLCCETGDTIPLGWER